MAKATISRFTAATAMLVGAFGVVGFVGSDSVAVSAADDDYLQSFDTAGSLDDMVFEIADGRSFPGDAKSFGGDHGLPGADGMCTAPEEQRPLSSGGGNYEIPMRFGNSAVRSSGLAYWCPNGGQHMMTSFDTSGYAHFDFRPKRTFTDVRKVCWDQNITDMGPGKWTEVAVVPLDVFTANGRRMDYTHPSRNGPKEPGSWGLKITDGVFKGGFHGDSQSSSVNQLTDSGKTDSSSTEDKRLRTQHCVSDNGNGTVTMSRGLSTGATQVDVLRGSLPLGESVVIFSDVSYNPDKRPGHEADENTWHWDNLFVSSDSDTIAPTGGGAPPVSQPPVVPSKAGQFDPLPPARLFDSRAGESTVDGRFVGGGLRGQGSLTKVDVVGRGSVSSDVGAVALTVTAVDSRWGGYVTVYSCDRSRPHASSLNYGVRDTVANTVLTELSSDGEVCVYNSAPIDLVIDVTGSFPA